MHIFNNNYELLKIYYLIYILYKNKYKIHSKDIFII